MDARQSERLVGRDAELATIERFLGATPPSARTLVLTGGPGFGKTALWVAGIESVRRHGTTALAARPSEAEAALGYAALGDLLHEVDDSVLAALPSPQRNALEVALLRSEPTDPPPEARAIAAGFLGVLRELAHDGPVVVAVDEVGWLDAASADAVSFARRRLVREPIAFLLTCRTGPGPGPEQLWTEGSERMGIGGMSREATRQMLADRLDFHPDRTLLRRIVDSTDGNPLFALELARHLVETDPQPGPEQTLAVPSELGALLTHRLAKLPPTARTAAVGAALAAEPSTGLVEALLGTEATTALSALIEADVVRLDGERVRFVHPLLASTITSAAAPQQRREMHRTLARLLDDPVASARHLSRASVDPDETVADALEEAATIARSRGGWDVAAELLERSRDLTPPSRADLRTRRALAAAEHHIRAGDRSRARALLEDVLRETHVRSHRAYALRLQAEVSAEDENVAGATAIYKQALEYADDPLDEVAIEAGLAYVLAMSWDVEMVQHAERALEVAEWCGDVPLRARALAACAMVGFMCGRGPGWTKVQTSLELEDREALTPLQARPSTVAALLYAYTGDHVEGRERLSTVRDWAVDRGEEGDLAFVLVILSWLETRAGDLAAATSVAEQAEMYARLTGSQAMAALSVAQQAFIAAHEGDEARTRDVAARATSLGGQLDFLLPGAWSTASLALLEMSLGNAEAAWRACEDHVALLEALGIPEPILFFFLPDALDALITLGQFDRADALITSLEARGRDLDRAWALAMAARCRGLLLAANDDLAGADVALTRALAEHDRLDMPFERARTLLAKGIVGRRAKRRANARSLLAEALDTFERVGARIWAERARDELSRVSGRRVAAAGELTRTERRVANLAAEGLSNKEIANTLFVSVHTVETHLSHTYSKLGVRSRAQLARRLVPQE